jgi:hypothetical protein
MMNILMKWLILINNTHLRINKTDILISHHLPPDKSGVLLLSRGAEN